MSGYLDVLKAAVAEKNRKNSKPGAKAASVPKEIRFVERSGTYVASDGKSYTIIYDKEPQNGV